MRTLPSASSWLKRTPLRWTAEYSFTGTLTRPKEMAPVQIARGMGLTSYPCGGGALPPHGSLHSRLGGGLALAGEAAVGLREVVVGALGELLDDLRVERRQVAGVAARGQAGVDVDLLV